MALWIAAESPFAARQPAQNKIIIPHPFTIHNSYIQPPLLWIYNRYHQISADIYESTILDTSYSRFKNLLYYESFFK